jgi:predicted Zn-dependent protease
MIHLLRLTLTLPLIVILSCSSLPGANVSEAEINAQAEQAYREVLAKTPRSHNAEWTAMVERVAKRIAASTNEPTFKWEIALLENKEANAWCMPGGKMAVYTGIMPILKTEGALAAVLGHEVAHATQRHGKERYARAVKGQYIGLGIGLATVVGGQLLCKTEKCRQISAMGGAAAGFLITFLDLKYSRADESEADHYGQTYMAKAGYDPAESIRLWERMGAASNGKAPPEILSTHPSDATRRANLEKWLPNAEQIYQQAEDKRGVGDPI